MKTTNKIISGTVCLKIVACILIVFTALGNSYGQDCVNCNPDTLSGLYPSVMGGNTKVIGNYSFAGGFFSRTEGDISFAFGNRAYVTGSYSVALGMFVRTIGTSAMIFGRGFSINEPLVNNVDRSLMIGFGSTKPTLFVGESIGANYTGKVGIGNVTDPLAKLHIRADDGMIAEHATLRLEATAADKYARIYLGDAHHITAANQQNMSFSLPADRNFIFENGKVGIGTDEPEAKLHVNGDFQVGDLENPQEIRLHGSINAEGDYATALGYGNTASGHSSFASGNSSVAYGPMTTAIGADVLANAPLSAAIGQFLSTYGSNSFAIGRGKNDDLRLTNGTPNSLLIGFNSDKPTFFVSETPYGYQTGKVGIGNVTAPQAKLHIRADEQEDASLRLEATAADKYARIYFGDAHHITAANQQNMSFSLPADRSFIFENGKVGIGTDQPEAKLHVNGDFQVGDLENPQQIRLHGKINVMGGDGTAFGDESTASGNYSFVAGRNSHIHSTPDYPGHYSNIIGSWSKIEHGAHANVIGSFSEATNNFSFVLGTWSKTKGSSSFAIGSHVEAWSGGSFIIGNGQDTTKFINTIPNSLMVGFGSTLPTLFVEKAPFSFDNDRTGQIGIGNITDPQAKLHIRADEQEDATLRLEATGSGKHSRIYFTDEHHITAAADDHMHFHTAEDKGFVFHEGDIYLSDIQSGIIMKSPNGQCWRGVMTDAGSLSFTQTTCPDEASFVPEPPVQQGKLKAYPNPTNGNLIIESVLYGSNTEIAISSMEGKMMLRQMITSERTEVSLKSFTPGTYILQLLTNGQLVESRKVVRQ